jgi:hypothetical protein
MRTGIEVQMNVTDRFHLAAIVADRNAPQSRSRDDSVILPRQPSLRRLGEGSFSANGTA